MDTKIGIVGFFDILGYQNLLEKNEPEEVAETILPFLSDIGIEVANGIKKSFKRGSIVVCK